MKSFLKFICVFALTLFFACTPSKETEVRTEDKEIYVFDDVEKIDTASVEIKNETQIPETTDSLSIPKNEEAQHVEKPYQKFLIQVGAFTTKERAETFVRENQNKTDHLLNISFNEQVQLFVVQLLPFESREEAERIKSELRAIPVFKGAFIVVR